MSKKTFPINYTSRDFDSIREELIEYIKKYYPDTYQDFSDASFGSLMVDSVSYIGDILSFYLDYQANESFLHTSVEFENILKLGRQMGYKYTGSSSAFGVASFFVSVPALQTTVGPDLSYAPILKFGTQMTSASGAKYILNEDVIFSNPNNEIRVSRVNASTGAPELYAIKAFGEVVSGELIQQTVTLGAHKEFLRFSLNTNDVVEIISVVDSDGNEYYETEFLSQDVIYKSIANRSSSTNDQATAIMKPFVTPRRFVTEIVGRKMFLQFGASSKIDTPEDSIADPASSVIQRHGRTYTTDTSFNPSKLVKTDKMGISPSNTTLIITARVNNTSNANSQTGQLNNVSSPIFEFANPSSLTATLVNNVKSSLEVDNESPIIGDVAIPSTKELKTRIYDNFATQNRAVTREDYQALIYQMPPKFGSVKRVNIVRDDDSFKRNLNAYLIAEDANGYLTSANSVVKKNIKTWLSKNKMINDTIDLLDAKVINIGIDFEAIGDVNRNSLDIYVDALERLREHFSTHPNIGEPFFITDIYAKLKEVEGLLDVSSVRVYQKIGSNYSSIRFDLEEAISADGRYIEMPKNVIYEVKFLKTDIKGIIK